MKNSYIADNIMRDYNKKKRYETNRARAELDKFIKENCRDCKNKKTNLCKINKNTDGDLQCIYKY